MKTQEEFLKFLETCIIQINNQKKIASTCIPLANTLDIHDSVIQYIATLKDITSGIDIPINYIQQFQNDINQIIQYFPYKEHIQIQLDEEQKPIAIKLIEDQLPNIEQHLKVLQFNLDFFRKLSFFNKNIVAIGANGSGKTTYSNKLKEYLPKNGVVISAQKILIIPTFSGISNYDKTSEELARSQSEDKSNRLTYSTEQRGNDYHALTGLGGEFKILLDNLLAERSAILNKFCYSLKNGSKDSEVPITKLDKALEIWNDLLEHRTIKCNDGINITLEFAGIEPYPAYKMSDGEKVMLYLIAQVLQAPENGFIIVDEPEMYLHKTILTKLWDNLEKERPDCIFVYLTHDLDFATSRTTAKKIWIRSFKNPDKWEIEDIPDNDLPEPLLLELLGSRKNILFCEGEIGSIDEKIYNRIFPEFTIKPLGGCTSVINYTKAFNNIPNSTINIRAYGLIDSDHHSEERLNALKSDNIFSLSMTEPENLLLDEDFLKLFAEHFLSDVKEVDKIKLETISQFEKEIELQLSNFVSAKINDYFNGSHMSKGNNLKDVDENYKRFTEEIKIEEWYESRKTELEVIIKTNGYSKALLLYNNKGLKAIAIKHLKMSDFVEKAIKFLQIRPEAQDILRKYFPIELKDKSNK